MKTDKPKRKYTRKQKPEPSFVSKDAKFIHAPATKFEAITPQQQNESRFMSTPKNTEEETETETEAKKDGSHLKTTEAGDKSPEYVAWFKKHHSKEEFEAKYAGRKVDLP